MPAAEKEAPKTETKPASTKILVENREAHILTLNRRAIPMMRTINGKEEQAVERDPKTGELVPAQTIPPPVRILPGICPVDRKAWEEVKDEPLVKMRLDGRTADGAPLKPGIGGDQPTLRVVNDSDELPRGNATSLIVPATYDVDLLKRWAHAADNQSVKELIALQIMRCEEPAKYEALVEKAARDKR